MSKKIKLKLRKTERPNYWYKDEKTCQVIYKSQSGVVRYRERENNTIEDLNEAYNQKIMYLWRCIFFKLSANFDFKLQNLVNTTMIDFRLPIKNIGNFYYLKIENTYFKVHTGTMRKLEITSREFLALPDDSIILNLQDYDIKDPGSSIVY